MSNCFYRCASDQVGSTYSRSYRGAGLAIACSLLFVASLLIYSSKALASLGTTLNNDFSQCGSQGKGKALLNCFSRALSICGSSFSKQSTLQKTGALLRQAASQMRGASTIKVGIHVLANLRAAIASTGELNSAQASSLRAALSSGIAALQAAGG
jgi:hypothetical protein